MTARTEKIHAWAVQYRDDEAEKWITTSYIGATPSHAKARWLAEEPDPEEAMRRWASEVKNNLRRPAPITIEAPVE